MKRNILYIFTYLVICGILFHYNFFSERISYLNDGVSAKAASHKKTAATPRLPHQNDWDTIAYHGQQATTHTKTTYQDQKPDNKQVMYHSEAIKGDPQKVAGESQMTSSNTSTSADGTVTDWGLSKIDLPPQSNQQQNDNLVMGKEITRKNQKLTYSGQTLAAADYMVPFQNETLTRFSVRINQSDVLWKLTLTDPSGKNIGVQEGRYQQLDIPLYGEKYNDIKVTITIEQQTQKPVSITKMAAVNRVSIAVIDSGISQHDDFSDNILYSLGQNFSGGDKNDITDNYGHGTHVMGILAAAGKGKNRLRGVLGHAPVDVIPIKALNDLGLANDTTISQAIDYAKQLKVNVINLSIAGQGESTQLGDAIRDAIQAGIVVVAASGNNNTSINEIYPASYPGVLTVTGSDQQNRPLSLDDYGWKVDLTAPGDQIWSTYLNNSYRTLSGTSMAVPYVSGAAALLKSKDPTLSVIQIRRRLIDSAKDIGTPGMDPKTGAGLLQVGKALQMTERPMVDWLTLKNGQPFKTGEKEMLAVDPSLVGDTADVSCNGMSFAHLKMTSQWQRVSVKCPDDGYLHETISVSIKNQAGQVVTTDHRIAINALIKNPFKDVSNNSWAVDDILSAYHSQIVKGYPDHTVRPNQRLTRRHAMMMIANARHFPESPKITKLPYNDVKRHSPGAKDIFYATQKGLVHGYKNHSFHPEAPLTRGEAAVILNKLTANKKPTSGGNSQSNHSFIDVSQDYFAYKSIQHLTNLGVIKKQKMFHPDAPITRAEFIVMLNHAQSFFK